MANRTSQTAMKANETGYKSNKVLASVQSDAYIAAFIMHRVSG